MSDAADPPALAELLAFARPVRHEANNLLGVLSGTAEILLRLAEEERDRARAERLREATDRLSALLRAYLALAAPPSLEAGVDAAQVVALLRPLLVLTLGPGRPVEIATTSASLPRVAMTQEELQLTVLRQARLAADAAPRGGGLALRLDPAPGGVHLLVAPTPIGRPALALLLPALARQG